MGVNINLVKKLREVTGAGILDCSKALINSNFDLKIAINNMRKIGQIKSLKKMNIKITQGVILAKISKNYGVIIELNCESDFVSKNSIFINFGNEVLNFFLEKVKKNCFYNFILLNDKFKEKRLSLIYKIGENINIQRINFLKGSNLDFYIHNFRIGVLISLSGNNKIVSKFVAMHIAASNPKYIRYNDIPSYKLDCEYKIQYSIVIKSVKSIKYRKNLINKYMIKFINEISLLNQPFIKDSFKSVSQILKENNIYIKSFIRFELGINN